MLEPVTAAPHDVLLGSPGEAVLNIEIIGVEIIARGARNGECHIVVIGL